MTIDTILLIVIYVLGMWLIYFFIRDYVKRNMQSYANQGAAWAIAHIYRMSGYKLLACNMAREWGFLTVDDISSVDNFDRKTLEEILEVNNARED